MSLNIDKSTTLTTDVYGINNYVNEVKKKFTPDVNEDTLMLGIFGYTGQMFSDLLQNTIVMASEFSNESIPTKAKFEKNIIAHALGLGITDINAIPSQFDVLLTFIEDDIIKLNGGKEDWGTFTFDRDTQIWIGDHCFHTDYDIEIKKIKLNNTGELDSYAYTARYKMGDEATGNFDNPISNITNPYLTSPVQMNVNGTSVIFTSCTLHQVKKSTVYKKVLSDNSITSKTVTFEFDGQLAAFTIDVTEGNTTTHLIPVYEGLSVEPQKYPYFYYSYLDSNTIRIKFDRTQYQPRINSDVRINIQTTEGESGNFVFDPEVYPAFSCSSSRCGYSNIGVEIRPVTGEAMYGTDKKSIDDLKQLIPKEALSRGSITNLTDLENFFNMLNTDDSKMYFYKKRDNILERLYYSYILMRDAYNVIIPTNTIDMRVTPDQLMTEEGSNKLIFKKGQVIKLVDNGYTIIKGEYSFPDDMPNNVDVGDFAKAGKTWYVYNGIEWEVSSIDPEESAFHGELYTPPEDETIDDGSFKYVIPYNFIINTSPLYGMYFLSVVDTKKFLDFSYINSKCLYQYIATNATLYRGYLEEPNTYSISISTEQNVDSKEDNPMIIFDESGDISDIKIKCVAVFYDEDDEPYRWAEAKLDSYDIEANIFNFKFKFFTEDYIDIYNRIKIDVGSSDEFTNMRDIGATNESYGHFKANTKCIIHILSKQDTVYVDEGTNNRSKLFEIIDFGDENKEEYTLSNSYQITEGVDFFHDYSDIISSTVISELDENESPFFRIKDVPVVKYDYFDTEDKALHFCKELVERKNYIDYAIQVLEDAFEMDFKFFNTYGPSRLFTLDNVDDYLNRTQLSLTFKCRFNSAYIANSTLDEAVITNNIISDIKEYIEDINEISSLHMSNLVTEITNKYREFLIFFEFVDINGYGPGYEHLYAMEMPNDIITPEFLNVAALKDGTPDITLINA